MTRFDLAENFRIIKIEAEIDSEIDKNQDDSDDDDEVDFFYISDNKSDYPIKNNDDDFTNNTDRINFNNIINLSGSRNNFSVKVNQKTSGDSQLLENDIDYLDEDDLDDDRNLSLSSFLRSNASAL